MSWLPHGFEFLSGLPEYRRRRRNLVVIQAFADDSGVFDGRSTVLTFAAVMGPAEHWAEFSDEWDRYLHSPPGINYFKMKEAAGLNGEFRGWTDMERDAKLRGLAQVLNRHPRLVCVYGCELKAAKFLATQGNAFKDLYVGALQTLIYGVASTLWDAGVREQFEMIFDENVIYGPRAKAWYPASKAIVRIESPGAYSILPTDIIFQKDEDRAPLQAADLFAGCIRDAQERDLSGKPNSEHPFNWILREFSRIKPSKYSVLQTEKDFIDERMHGTRVAGAVARGR